MAKEKGVFAGERGERAITVHLIQVMSIHVYAKKVINDRYYIYT